MTNEEKEIPQILVSNGVLTITINAEELKWITEHKLDSSFKVLDANDFLSNFAANLETYQTSNAKELGISELQNLFSIIIDETYINGSEAIVDVNDDL